MQINGGIRFCEQGMKASIKAMHLQTEVIGMINENVTGFDKIGYQRREPVVSSFSEYIGIHGLSKTIDDKVGRIMVSKNPLDIALANKETLVMAGDIVMPLAKSKGVNIIPVDSEHCAIHQCIKDISQVEKLIITASGGPFLCNSRRSSCSSSLGYGEKNNC